MFRHQCVVFRDIVVSTLLSYTRIQPGATVRRYLFTAKSLYIFRVSQYPSSGVLKTVTAASGTGNNTGTATSFQRGLIRLRVADFSLLHGYYTNPATPKLQHTSKQENTTNVVIQ